MGFMDKAKKMAEQAQAKLDEVQKSVNTTQGGPPADGAPVVEYDKHGRPIQPAAVTPDAGAPPVATPGVPQTEPPAPVSVGPPGSEAPTPDSSAPAAAPAPAPKPPAPPTAAAAPGGPPAPEDRNRPNTEAPKLSSGDPLAG
jgi:hypothetical protein